MGQPSDEERLRAMLASMYSWIDGSEEEPTPTHFAAELRALYDDVLLKPEHDVRTLDDLLNVVASAQALGLEWDLEATLSRLINASVRHEDWFCVACASTMLAFERSNSGRIVSARKLMESHLPTLIEEGTSGGPYVKAAAVELALLDGQLAVLIGDIDSADARVSEVTSLLGNRTEGAVEGADVLTQRLTLERLRADVFVELGLIDRAAEHVRAERSMAVELADEALLREAIAHEVDLLLGTRRFDATVRAVDGHLVSDLFEAGDRTTYGRALLKIRRGRARLELARTGDEAAAALAESDFAAAYPSLGALQKIDAALARAELAQLMGKGDRAGEHLREAEERLDATRASKAAPSPLVYHEAWALALRSQREANAVPIKSLERVARRALEQWDRVAPRRGGHGFLLYGERRIVLSELLERTKDDLRALEWIAEFQARGSLARSVDATVLPIETTLRRLTRRNGRVLVWVAGRDRTTLFSASAKGVSRQHVGHPRRIEKLRKSFARELRGSARGGTEWESTGRELMSALGIDEFESDKSRRVGPDGDIGVVHCLAVGLTLPALERLPTSSSDNERRAPLLGETLALSHLPSLALVNYFDALGPAETSSGAELVVIASPLTSKTVIAKWPKAVRFETSARLNAEFRAGFAMDQVLELKGRKATLAALRSPRASSALIWHFIAHGLSDPLRERSAGLALAFDERHDGAVWCSDVEALDVPPLVLLTACVSARGPLRSGDDLGAHLGGAFLRAGAQAVLLSDSEVELDAAAALQAHFLKRVRMHGATPAEALRDARAALASRGDTHVRDLRIIGLGDVALF